MIDKVDFSILIPTYNRSESIDLTLRQLCAINKKSISYEIIVIDNNSSDRTKDVVEKYYDKLPIKYIFEKKQGKNVALNKGIEVAHGDVLVFIDDDVSVEGTWLESILNSVTCNPYVNIFGGKILTKWPNSTPDWVYHSSSNFPFLFRSHDLGNEVVYYTGTPLPAGANFWMKRNLLEKHNVKFNEQFGPYGNKRVAGSETEFLKRMLNLGEKMLYVPDALVHHRVLYNEFAIHKLLHRFCASGRSEIIWTDEWECHFKDSPFRQILGLPPYLIRQLFEEILKTTVFAILFNKSKCMNSLIKSAYFYGKANAFLKRAR